MNRFFKKLFSKFTIILLILIFLLLSFFYWGWIEKQFLKLKGVYYIYKGDQAYSQDDIASTLKYYKNGLKLYPEHYEAWFNFGNIYATYEDYISAIDAYENAIKYNPKYVLARMNLGIIYSENLGFFNEAIEQFEVVTDLKFFKLWIPFVYSNIKSIRINKGRAYYNMGVVYRKKALYLPPDKYSLVYQYLNDAIDSYTKAEKYLKKNYDLYYNRAVAYHLKSDYRNAGMDYCKAISIEPMKFEAHYNLAVLLRHLHKYQESISELEKAALLILESSDSTTYQSSYVFNLLNEVSRTFITNKEYYAQKITDEPSTSISYTYVNGRIVPDEELDKAILKNFSTCAGKNYFVKDFVEE